MISSQAFSFFSPSFRNTKRNRFPPLQARFEDRPQQQNTRAGEGKNEGRKKEGREKKEREKKKVKNKNSKVGRKCNVTS